MKKIFAAALAAALGAFSADAAITLTSSSYETAANGGLADSLTTNPGAVLFNFDNTVIIGSVNGFNLSNNNTVLSLTNVAGVSGSDTFFNTYAQPTGDGTSYVKVGGGGTETIANTTNAYNMLSLYWGSPDTFNTITFLDQTGTALGTVSAASVAGLVASGTSSLVTLGTDQSFYGVTFGSSSNAFELDNVKFSNATVHAPAAVPEPASWAMMIVGFGAVGYAMRRRMVRGGHRILG